MWYPNLELKQVPELVVDPSPSQFHSFQVSQHVPGGQLLRGNFWVGQQVYSHRRWDGRWWMGRASGGFQITVLLSSFPLFKSFPIPLLCWRWLSLPLSFSGDIDRCTRGCFPGGGTSIETLYGNVPPKWVGFWQKIPKHGSHFWPPNPQTWVHFFVKIAKIFWARNASPENFQKIPKHGSNFWANSLNMGTFFYL